MKQWYYAKAVRQFGPFQKSRIAELYQQGEIAAGDLVWEEGAPAWVPAREALGQPAAPSASAPVPTPAAGATVSDGKLHPFSCVERAWDLVWKHPAEIIGGCVLVGVTNILAQIPMMVGSLMLPHSPADNASPRILPELPVAGGILYCAGLVFSVIVGALMIGGVYRLLLNATRGQPRLTDLFYGCKNLGAVGLPLILASLLTILFIIFGYVCLILPGIWLGVCFSFVKLVIVDRNPGIIDALKRSLQLVTDNWWRLCGLLILMGLICLVGYLACCVGIIIAAPLAATALVIAYTDLAKSKGEQ
ncbi:MAG: GYF domain-containing protein [Verrucomicrobiales bacterium]|jgi:hypothetical protein|nr:GYF domain-containing protein [Verrucomicrobiales bacterium]